ncbi:MAG: excisionase family DNA-binding protein [Planctomycetota bacterium]|nr:excisionase family DNA-binding protein [Planctomycetota bacterium]
MATKFIQLDEAAEQLGISVEQLVEMRSRNEIRGFRDGTTWKFKSDDVEKLAGTMQSGGSAAADTTAGQVEEVAGDSDLELTLEDDAPEGSDVPQGEESVPPGEISGEEDDESVLLSERELGGSDVTGKSTIIDDSTEASDESDITLADTEGSTSDVQLVGDSMNKGSDIGLADSDIDLGTDDEAAQTMKQPAEPVEAQDAGSDLSLQFEDLSSLDLDSPDETAAETPADTSEPGADAGSDLSIASDSGLSLEGSDVLALDSDSLIESPSLLELSETEDEELVLGEGSGSNLMSGAGDSGISLGDPADSGLSLEEAPVDLDLAGSAIDESLVLGEDDMITLGDDLAGASGATQMKTDDDFLLTPLEGADEDLSESSSQVIPLDEFAGGGDQSQATMLLTEGQAGMELMEEDLTESPTMIGGVGAAAPAFAGAPQPAPAGMMQFPVIPEAQYSIWNVLSLFSCIAILCLTGMLIYDVVRQMWSWEGTYSVNSDLMQAILDLFT